MRFERRIRYYEDEEDLTSVPYLVVTLAKKLTGASADIKLGAMIVTLTIISVEIGYCMIVSLHVWYHKVLYNI